VFDQSGLYLRCSMHGIVYQPETGASVSTMCEGERLKSVQIYEADGEVGIADYRVSKIL
jgi:nitrite reductase/ring-hydroxylating ferredoxin subunit